MSWGSRWVLKPSLQHELSIVGSLRGKLWRYLARFATIFTQILQLYLLAVATGLQHTRGEVRQMSSALLNNLSLFLAASLPEASDGGELSDEATQILFGVLDGLQEEKSQVTWRTKVQCR